MTIPSCHLSAILLLVSIASNEARRRTPQCDPNTLCTDVNAYCAQESVCKKGYCLCKSGYSFNRTGACVPEVLLNSECTNYCSVGYCISGKCTCLMGLTASSDNRKCEGKTFGAICNTREDCEGGTNFNFDCISGTCQCASNYKKYNEHGCLWLSLGDYCISSTQCVGEYMTCAFSKCLCAEVNNNKYVWRSLHSGYGIWYGQCVHPSAKEVGYGEQCTYYASQNDAKLRYCGQGLQCRPCPENEQSSNSDYLICLSGSRQPIISSLFVMSTILISLVMSSTCTQ